MAHEKSNWRFRAYLKEQDVMSEEELDQLVVEITDRVWKKIDCTQCARCSVYSDRPADCRGYPYLYEPDFSFRMIAMIERTSTCPVVFQVMEELKGEVYDRRDGRQREV